MLRRRLLLLGAFVVTWAVGPTGAAEVDTL